MSITAKQIIDDIWGDSIFTQISDGVETIFAHHDNDVAERNMALKTLIDSVHENLLSHPVLQAAQAMAPEKANPSAPSWSNTLYIDSGCEISLVAVFNGHPIPLHDHPGSQGLSIVLSGNVQIREAQLKELDTRSGMSKLEASAISNCNLHEFSWFEKSRHNIHGIESITAVSHILVIHTPPVNRSSQSFYFPLEASNWTTGEIVAAKRIRIRQKFGH